MFTKWNLFPDVESFVNAVDACNFSSTIDPSVDYKRPVRGSARARNSRSLASSVHSSHQNEIQCSKFRIHMLPLLYSKRKWDVEPLILHSAILALFHGDEERCERFITDQSRKLEAFRTFFFFYIHDGDGVLQDSKSIPEVKIFQPLFQLFLGGFLKCLETDTNTSKRTASVNSQKLTKANIGEKSFTGYLDVMIFPKHFLEDDVCMSHSHFELKSPFSSLCRSHAEKDIDQLIAETACVSAMKAAINSTAAPTVGAITDLFAMHLIYQVDSKNTKYYLTYSGVLESRIYIQQLLVLCLESSAVSSLAAASVAEDEILILEEDQESEQNDPECEVGDIDVDVDKGQQQLPQGGLKGGMMSDGLKENANNSNTSKAYREDCTISFNYEEEDDLADQLEFLRQYEMCRTGITLTRANLALLGGTR